MWVDVHTPIEVMPTRRSMMLIRPGRRNLPRRLAELVISKGAGDPTPLDNRGRPVDGS